MSNLIDLPDLRNLEDFTAACGECDPDNMIGLNLWGFMTLLGEIRYAGGIVPRWCYKPLHELMGILITVRDFHRQCFPQAANDP